MRGSRLIIWIILLLALVLLVSFVARHTYWGQVPVPMPMKGEALTNPFYAAEHLVEALGAQTAWDHDVAALPPGGVAVVSGWHWSLSAARRERLEQWVESGGRLVIDRTLVGDEQAFEGWSGVQHVDHEVGTRRRASQAKTRATSPPSRTQMAAALRAENCVTLTEETAYRPLGTPEGEYRICGLDAGSALTSTRRIDWALRGRNGIGALRVTVGRGHVSVINAVAPFTRLDLFQEDHARLLVDVTELRRGDQVHFLSEDTHGSLVSLLWEVAAPAVALVLGCIALLLWRRGARFGPLVPAPERARRSLSEQIVGTGQFLLRTDGSAPLYAAALRALTEAARRRVPGYARLSSAEQAATLVQLTGLPARALSAAIEYRGARRRNELSSDVALIEAARRRILSSEKGTLHGNRVDHDHARG